MHSKLIALAIVVTVCACKDDSSGVKKPRSRSHADAGEVADAAVHDGHDDHDVSGERVDAAADARPGEDEPDAAPTLDSKPRADAGMMTPIVDAGHASGALAEGDEDEDAGGPPTTGAAADGGGAVDNDSPPEQPGVAHPFFSTVRVAQSATTARVGDGDLWPSCWGDDDAVYAAAGDGTGFDVVSTLKDVFVARIDGLPTGTDGLRGTLLSAGDDVGSIWNGGNYNRKPTGMLCLGSDLYLAVQDLRLNTFSDAPAATILRSTDKGKTWSWDQQAPMFSDHVFTTIMFLDFGKGAEHAPADYVYAYGLDENWAFQTTTRLPPTKLYLARVPREKLQDRTSWEFFAGFSESNPRWTSDISARAAVLEDTRRLYTTPFNSAQPFQDMTVINQGGVVYDAPLQRYIYTSWTEYTFEFYEAPEPWGPWKLFYSKDFGITPWDMDRNGGYATTVPSKFISADGRTLWLQSNAWLETGVNHYGFSLRELALTPYAPSTASNAKDPESLATAANGAVVFATAMRNGEPEVLNDGTLTRQSEDSWDGNEKTSDYWGYTWPKSFNLDLLRYTTGRKTSEGGWFEDLTVQYRRGDEWVPVTNLRIEPSYSFDMDVPDTTTFDLHFDAVATDGIRLYGKPGGSGTFTTIAELSAHYE